MATRRYECDLLVVGAGPAGASAALGAAKNGLSVIVLEKKRPAGRPIQCAEYIPAQLLREVQNSSDFIVQRILGMKTFLPGGEASTDDSAGFIIERDKFDLSLLAEAAAYGAKILLKTQALSHEGGLVLTKDELGTFEIIPSVIIGADGPKSTVGDWMGSINTEFICAAQFVMPLTAQEEYTQVYFSKSFPGGYGWLFPKGEVANVGVGVDPKFGIAPINALKGFIGQLISEGRVKDRIIQRTAGLIPSGGLIDLVQGNMLLAGDAGGGPFTPSPGPGSSRPS
ncbi:MAG: geranylgeranyl reductase family protein [Actinomycetota bacterium]|nr:geranylgeranyl reductase family protein [Actinomycetota bacterium]